MPDGFLVSCIGFIGWSASVSRSSRYGRWFSGESSRFHRLHRL